AQERVGDGGGARESRERAAPLGAQVQGDDPGSLGMLEGRFRSHAHEGRYAAALADYQELVRRLGQHGAPRAMSRESEAFRVVVTGTSVSTELAKAGQTDVARRILFRAFEAA